MKLEVSTGEQTVDGMRVFFPQRVLSVKEKTLSGVFLGTNDIDTLELNNDKQLEKVLELQSSGRLVDNNEDDPRLFIFISKDRKSFVFYDQKIKPLFCHSVVVEKELHILKASISQSFSSDDWQEAKDFAKTHISKDSSATMIALLDIDGNQELIRSHEELESVSENYLNLIITPVLIFPHSLSLNFSNLNKSLVFLSNTGGLKCIYRSDVSAQLTPVTSEQSENKKIGLDAYFSKLKNK